MQALRLPHRVRSFRDAADRLAWGRTSWPSITRTAVKHVYKAPLQMCSWMRFMQARLAGPVRRLQLGRRPSSDCWTDARLVRTPRTEIRSPLDAGFVSTGTQFSGPDHGMHAARQRLHVSEVLQFLYCVSERLIEERFCSREDKIRPRAIAVFCPPMARSRLPITDMANQIRLCGISAATSVYDTANLRWTTEDFHVARLCHRLDASRRSHQARRETWFECHRPTLEKVVTRENVHVRPGSLLAPPGCSAR